MTQLEALLLGIIQGITEFLPVSSSGHLTLAQTLFGLGHTDELIFFDLICHLGTLLAILVFFAKPLKTILLHDKKRVIQVIIGTLPLFPLILVLSPLKATFGEPRLLGIFFLITSLILFIGIRLGKEDREAKKSNYGWKDALWIGVFQALAVLPGISRSGATISSARMIGWKRYDAVLFSFLLAIPAILGAMTLESAELLLGSATLHAEISLSHYLIAFGSSFTFGVLSLGLLVRLALKEQLMYFVWYCLILGITTLFYTNFIL